MLQDPNFGGTKQNTKKAGAVQHPRNDFVAQGFRPRVFW
jgi:hypothetical protein